MSVSVLVTPNDDPSIAGRDKEMINRLTVQIYRRFYIVIRPPSRPIEIFFFGDSDDRHHIPLHREGMRLSSGPDITNHPMSPLPTRLIVTAQTSQLHSFLENLVIERPLSHHATMHGEASRQKTVPIQTARNHVCEIQSCDL